MSDALGDRWISLDDFIVMAANAVSRPKSEIRTFLREIAETRGVSVGVSVIAPGEARKVVANRVQGPGAYSEAAKGLVDLNELWLWLNDEFSVSSPLEVNEAASAQTAGAEARCRRHLVEIMRASPQRATMRNADLKRDMQKQFPGLGERAFARAKEAAIDEARATAWRAPGRKPRH